MLKVRGRNRKSFLAPNKAPEPVTHNHKSSPAQVPIIQRKPICPCDGGCPSCSEVIQPKLKIGAPNDKYEQEADRVADQVMRMPEPTVQRKAGCSSCGDLDEEEPIQVKSLSNKSPSLTRSLHSQIQSLKSGGQPLPKSTRNFFEPRFGTDFGKVRVHTGPQAGNIAKSINAKAFTKGTDVVFGTSQYSPETHSGKHLLAHELTHVVQQKKSHSIKGRKGISLKKIDNAHIIQLYRIIRHRITPRTLNHEERATASFNINQDKTGQWEIRNPGDLSIGNPCIRSSQTDGIRRGHRTCPFNIRQRHLQDPGYYRSHVVIDGNIHQTTDQNSLKVLPDIQDFSINPRTGITGFGQRVTINLRVVSPTAGFQGNLIIVDRRNSTMNTCRTGLLRDRIRCRWDGLKAATGGRVRGPLATGGPFRVIIMANGIRVYRSSLTFPISTRFQQRRQFGTTLDTPANWLALTRIIHGEMRGESRPYKVAVGWIVINRMLRSNTTNLNSVAPAAQFSRLTGSPQSTQELAHHLLQGRIRRTTTGTHFISPRRMPRRAERGCCTRFSGTCPRGRQNNVACGFTQNVPGVSPADMRWFPPWAASLTLQGQPTGAGNRMTILVYQ
jgi:Domain of unknown function (DUF4157)